MIRYYNSRELSSSLGYNLSRWKRWSRDFLPPDPLGGLQSGYARQYSMREAFVVALGGHLVGFLKFSVHQAGIILSDLDPWLEKSGYFKWNPNIITQKNLEEQCRQRFCLYIRRADETGANMDGFAYAVGVLSEVGLSDENIDLRRWQHKTVNFINNPDEIKKYFLQSPFVVLLSIGPFRRYFLNRICPKR